ncbi:MAG: hypothetical protein K1X89_31515, partial [Myxococcaceae bacterium]|nr:hypothetical protein [Myxococcaceae bacterium]
MKRLLLALLCAAPAFAETRRAPATEPIADVWPYDARRTPGGAWEYRYDLTALKVSGGTSDAIAAHGQKDVKAFLAGLPREAKVTVKPGAQLTVGEGRGLEPVPLVSVFSQVSAEALASADPLGHKERARLRQPLAPEEPKLLVSVDQVALAADAAIGGALKAALDDTEQLHKALWTKVYAAVAARYPSLGGDAVDGAGLLLARLGAALSCLEAASRPALPRKDAVLVALADGEFERLKADPELQFAAGAAGCHDVRRRVLAEAFGESRASAAAALLVVAALEADPKLKAQHATLVARRQALEGGPADEPLLTWAAKGGKPAKASLDELGPFLEAAGTVVPPLFVRVPRLAERFSRELEPNLRPALVDELLAAAQDQPPSPKSAAPAPARAAAEQAWLPLAYSEGSDGLSFERGWRTRLQTLFAAMHGLHRDTEPDSTPLPPRPDGRADLEVRLMVPPVLEVEPAPLVYGRAAESAQRLLEVLKAQGLLGVRTASGEGAGEALKRWAPVLRGLARLSKPAEAAKPDDADTSAARRFLAAWRSDPVLAGDVR